MKNMVVIRAAAAGAIEAYCAGRSAAGATGAGGDSAPMHGAAVAAPAGVARPRATAEHAQGGAVPGVVANT